MEARPDPSVKRIELEGEYDLTRKDEIASMFGCINGEASVVIDMAKVTYMDSTVLKELATLRLRDASRLIRVAGPNQHIRRLLRLVSFDKLFEITE